ncbi:hypothetical protein [Herpetosiphon geysericola]|uniref:Uncharacterized protein n=1 Tax=Herpetosiphon geysericola TaxID=70996 RepID=A0A0N8GPG8_9CHLR|nr:hypothetical protein [Herpetosiphon geysericola]KPL80858.1 hypothetical protein SE18_23520 [Herpetosiphon geysericola]
MTSPYDHEFQAFLAPLLAGLSVAARHAELDRLTDLWQREGAVPVNGQLVWLGTPATTRLTATASVAPSPRTSQRWIGVVIIVVVVLSWVVLGRRSQAAPLAAGVLRPVTVTTDSEAAPVQLLIGSQAFAVQAFDPAMGWPDPMGIPAATAVWGGTRSQIVLGLDGTTLDADALTLGSQITLQQVRGDQRILRVVARQTVAVYASATIPQQQVGVTLVLWDQDDLSTRTLVQAIPADQPLLSTRDGAVPMTVTGMDWTLVAMQPTLMVSVTVGPTDQAGSVTHHRQPLVTLPVATATTISIPVTATAMPGTRVDLPLAVAGQAVPLSIAMPDLPVVQVEWQTVTATPQGLAITTVLRSPATVLLAADATCTVGGITTPLQPDQPWPLTITTVQTVVWTCPLDPAQPVPVTVQIGSVGQSILP